MPLWKVALLSFAALITMVNPLAVVPSFIALTDRVSRATRASVAFVAGLSCVIVLAVFLLAGNYVFKFSVSPCRRFRSWAAFCFWRTHFGR